MEPHHLTNRQRLIAILVTVAILGAGLFIDLMRQLERTPAEGPMRSPISTSPSASSSLIVPGENGPLSRGMVTVNGKTIPVELAKTEVEQGQGLSFRPSLGENDGMLFLFNHPQLLSFWMKDMRFPLDIIFINGSRVVRVAANLPAPDPGQVPVIVSSEANADAVLEINAGKAKAWGIKEGSEIKLSE